jgi:RNA binding exosome subunit
MKRSLLLGAFALLICVQTFAQLFPKKDSSGGGIGSKLDKFMKQSKSGPLSNEQVIAGLKEALTIGTERGTKTVSSLDGYFGNAAIKILMPEEAKKVEKTLRSVGLGKQVDDAILSMNRAAEDAAKSATPIFVNAVKQMSFQDAMGILKGADNAATSYLQSKTTPQLTEAFRPVIEESLKKVDATKYWNTVFTNYNKFSKEKINTDLSAYVTEKALSGIFIQLADEEKKIRKDPMARTTDILKQVFGAK